MVNKIKPRKSWPGPRPQPESPNSLKGLVDDYLNKKYYCKYSDKEETFADGHICYLNTLKNIIDFICGEPNDGRKEPPFKINVHQRFYRFPSRQSKIPQVACKLKKTIPGKYNSFEELYEKVNKQKLYGFGETTTYDFALRYGWHQNPRIEPKDFVYLHSKPMEAAKALHEKGYIKDKLKRTIPMESLPEEIKDSRMTAADVEHFFCCYKTFIDQLPNKKIK